MILVTKNRLGEYFEHSEKPLLLDGATGTEIIEMGKRPDECGELWNLKYQDKIESIARSYFDAGSDAVLTNTFGAISLRLKQHGLESFVYAINRSGAEIARRVCPPGKFILGNIGPSPAVIEPYGELPRQTLVEYYREQINGLLDGGVDGFSLETFADPNEIKCAIEALRLEGSSLPYLCSLTFDTRSKGYVTTYGTLNQLVCDLVNVGAFAIGSNCGFGIMNMVDIAGQFRNIAPDSRLIFKPNAGKPVVKEGVTTYDENPEFFCSHLPKLLEYKPSIIGGCCGTTPEHIRKMREFIDRSYR